jgi:6-phosphofructokinase 1
MANAVDFSVATLGPAEFDSPLLTNPKSGYTDHMFAGDDKYIINDLRLSGDALTRSFDAKELLQHAGPRKKLYFEPAAVHAGLVTCGGLCPGLNDVIRAVVMGLWYSYGVHRITGIRYGYQGLLPERREYPLELIPQMVEDIHRLGGSILGSARGGGDRIGEIVDTIEQMKINMLFTIGGDGTQSGALRIAEEAERRDLKLSVVGVPKTIDNDLSYIQKSFGFETAVSKAVEAVAAAHVEAHDAYNGIGIVKVMGRESGFIAAHTALAMNDLNFILIPELPFELDGDNGLLVHLKKRLEQRHHAVILVAEGAGQELLQVSGETDASGNIKLSDIGVFLKQKIQQYFDREAFEIGIKYIDPSYIIRAEPAIPNDSIYCARLGHNAVHAAMAGKTKMLISLVNNNYVHLPIAMAVAQRNRVDLGGPLWRDVIESTGQPWCMTNDASKA